MIVLLRQKIAKPGGLERAECYGADIRFGTSTTLCPNVFKTDFQNFDFFPPIEVDFSERTENHPLGILGWARYRHVYKGNYAKHH